MPEDLTIVDIAVKEVNDDTWRRFVAQAKIRKVKAGELLSKVLKEWLTREAT